MQPRAVHFGAGKIGRGFLGQLYCESGYTTTFVDVVDTVVDALNARGSYTIRLVEEDTAEVRVTGVSAIHGGDLEAVADALATADIASAAVGVRVLPHVAKPVALGIEKRFAREDAPPLNIILCENLVGAGPHFRSLVAEHLPEALHGRLTEEVGFVEASIGRMVPDLPAEDAAADPLLVAVEPYCELPVDREAFRGAVPEIAHLKAIDNFGSYVEQKLFVHNMTHAATAYLGYRRGHEYVWQAIRDPAVREIVEGAAGESCEALARKHGRDREELTAHYHDLIWRYHNRALGDPVDRVGGDPMRKLGPEDRLVGAMKCCLDQDVTPEHIAIATAFAIEYDNKEDPSAVRLGEIRAARGMAGVLEEVCGLAPGHPAHQLVLAASENLTADAWRT